MGGSTCQLSVKNFRPLSVVGKSQLIFLSLVGNFFLVLSVVSNIFSPFVASRLTPFTPSLSISARWRRGLFYNLV